MTGLDMELLEKAIQDSRRLLELGDDWDGEGSLPIAEATWEWATDQARKMALIASMNRRHYPPPSIGPGPNGGIDVYWQQPDLSFLLFVPADPAALFSCSGDNRSGREKSVELTSDAQLRELLEWLLA